MLFGTNTLAGTQCSMSPNWLYNSSDKVKLSSRHSTKYYVVHADAQTYGKPDYQASAMVISEFHRVMAIIDEAQSDGGAMEDPEHCLWTIVSVSCWCDRKHCPITALRHFPPQNVNIDTLFGSLYS